MISRVEKRNGEKVEFDSQKIEEAVYKAFTFTKEGGRETAREMTEKVLDLLMRRFSADEVPHVEEIQNIVEEVLIMEGFAETARNYIIYREKRREVRETASELEDPTELIESYIDELDWQVKENANMTYSLQGLNQYATSHISKKYWLNKIYPEKIREAAKNQDFHIHDLNILATYTFFGREVILVKFSGEMKLLSFRDLYEFIDVPESLLSEKDQAFAKYPEDLYVFDKKGWTQVKRLVKKKKEREMRFLKSEQGRSVVVTDNHPFIVKENEKGEEKEIESQEVKEKEHLMESVNLPDFVNKEGVFEKNFVYLAEELLRNGVEEFFLEGVDRKEFVKEWNGKLNVEGTISVSNSANGMDNKLDLTENLGYLTGMFIADGSYGSDKLVITTGEEKVIERIKKACHELGLRCYENEKKEGNAKNISINSATLKLLFEEVFRINDKAKNKNLPIDILSYNIDFAKGVVAGIIDGDGTVSPSDDSHNDSQVLIRVASRTMLEQLAVLLQVFGIVPRDRAEGVGSKRELNGREVVQNYPLYGLSFSKREDVEIPSFKYKEASAARKSWRADNYGWNKVLNNEVTEVYEEWIYDITTESGTLVCNGVLVHNCCGWDLHDILMRGFGGVPSKVESKPPKHLRPALGQIVNFFFTLQGECYSEDTEVLTKSGWKYFYEVKEDDEVFTLNTETGEMELHRPRRFYEFEHDGELYNFKSKKLDLLVTPNHNMLVAQYYPKKKDDYELKFIKAKDFNPRTHSLLCSDLQDKVSSHLKKEKMVMAGSEKEEEVLSSRLEPKEYPDLEENRVENIEKPYYKGKVYCLEVQNHTLYVRRNGKAAWCGNSAGAQAMSNFDTYLAPFIRRDGLNYKQVKQSIQEFIFNCMVPTRVGFQCLSEDTEILTKEGWKTYEQVKEGEIIKTFNPEKRIIEEKEVKKVFSREYEGKMYRVLNRIQDQLLSPNHRMVRKRFNTNNYVLEEVEKVMEFNSPQAVPIASSNNNEDIDLTNEEIKLAAWIISEGSLEKRGNWRRITIYQSKEKNKEKYEEILSLLDILGFEYSLQEGSESLGDVVMQIRFDSDNSREILKLFDTEDKVKKIPEKFLEMSQEQSRIFLETYIKGDGHERSKITVSDKETLEDLQRIVVNAGYGFTVAKRDSSGVGKKLLYILRLIRHQETYIREIKEVDYKGVIWSVNTDNETVIAKRKGKVFITGNTPFINTSLDVTVPDHLKDQPIVIGGEPQKETYGEFQEEMDIFNKAFYEVLMEGDSKGRPFTFPIPDISISKDFNWENPALDRMWEATAKYGINYFSNFVNSDMDPEDARSMCCRLRLDNRQLIKRGGGLFGSNPLTGSVGVVTINLPRIGYLSKDKDEYFQRLAELMDLAKDSLEIKRKVLEDFIEKGLYPYTKHYLYPVKQLRGSYFGNHFSTVGIIGMNESLLNFLGENIASENGRSFALEVMDFMRDRLVEYQEETDNLYNLEATPGEGASYRQARVDKEKYPDIITAGTEDAPYYTNSVHLPVGYTNDPFEALDLQDELQQMFTGGTVLHLFLGEKVDDPEAAKNLIRKVCENYHLPYVTITPTFSICPNCGYIKGEKFYCSNCKLRGPKERIKKIK